MKKIAILVSLMLTSFTLNAEPLSMYSYLCNKDGNQLGYQLSVGQAKTLVMYPGNQVQSRTVNISRDHEWLLTHVNPDEVSPACLSYFLSQGYWRSGKSIARFHFAFNSTQMSNDDKQIFAQVAKALSNTPNVSVVGHTDAIGSNGYNQTLGSKRAQAMTQKLVNEGENVMVTSSSRGEMQPIITNTTDSGRALNRRVEIIFDDIAR
ncbi:OmpA family protein [Vibrio nitrifigilis]|uniref:OmpA family protein n=1 Tax=Vibrio nitrifigilis TaxID=2789781 RepID=A0ABS0GIJ7_9VIBR|nr:OmpA family protein [Vibrio nitrifigilis]MBF9002249.1 OmpA family protein [Vibrio nitrifigilis]